MTDNDNPEQLADLCRELNLTCSAMKGKNVGPLLSPDMTGWRVMLSWGQVATLSTDYFTGSAIKEVTVADVLYSLLMDVTMVEGRSFEEWCDDLGLDTDSRRALKTYEACVAQVEPLKAFLGDAFDRFTRAEH